jgi:serine/threonine-protein kinase
MTAFGKFLVEGQLVTGSTGLRWKAVDPDQGRIVSIKELPPEVLGRQGAQERLRADTATLAGLGNPHLVAVYEYVEEPERAWLVQEWVDGASVDAVVAAARRLTAEQSLGILIGALRGLAAAHAAGVIHGDITPADILVDTTGRARLGDFGVVAPTGYASAIGTPAYLSPEAARGATVNAQSDVYAAAAVLFELLTGAPPYSGSSPGEVLAKHIAAPVPTVDGAGAKLKSLLARAMAKDPAHRPVDAGEFVEGLSEAAEERFGPGWLTKASVARYVAAAERPDLQPPPDESPTEESPTAGNLYVLPPLGEARATGADAGPLGAGAATGAGPAGADAGPAGAGAGPAARGNAAPDGRALRLVAADGGLADPTVAAGPAGAGPAGAGPAGAVTASAVTASAGTAGAGPSAPGSPYAAGPPATAAAPARDGLRFRVGGTGAARHAAGEPAAQPPSAKLGTTAGGDRANRSRSARRKQSSAGPTGRRDEGAPSPAGLVGDAGGSATGTLPPRSRQREPAGRALPMVAAGLVTLVVVTGAVLAFELTSGDESNSPSPQPTQAQPAPPASNRPTGNPLPSGTTTAARDLATAVLTGEWSFVNTVTRSEGFSNNDAVGIEYTRRWTFTADCADSPCPVRARAQYLRSSFDLVLTRQGTEYRSRSSQRTTCESQVNGVARPVSSAVTTSYVILRISEARWVDGRWQATRITGERGTDATPVPGELEPCAEAHSRIQLVGTPSN